MQAWTRPPEPPELRHQRAALTLVFIREKKGTGKTPSCAWPRVQNEDGDMESLQTMLSRHTARHCCYCDGLMGYTSRDTIDHFLPKSHFAHQAYRWTNLYFCCDGCQRKGTDYDKRALRPDESDYAFCRYFRSHRDGKISVIALGILDQERAEITLRILKLNDPKLISERCRVFRQTLVPRRRPIRPGLDATTALQRHASQQQSFEHRSYRFHYSQDPEC